MKIKFWLWLFTIVAILGPLAVVFDVTGSKKLAFANPPLDTISADIKTETASLATGIKSNFKSSSAPPTIISQAPAPIAKPKPSRKTRTS